jgi:hypothetical protein
MNRLRPEQTVAGFDSASAMLEATARGLRGQNFDRLGRGRGFAALLRAADLLPLGVRQRLYAVAGGAEGVAPERLGEVDAEAVAAWVTGHYPNRSYPAVLIGSSNGAAVHLATALGVPWLPQTLLIPVRWKGNTPDRPDAAAEFGARVAPALLDANPDLALHHMHDANQDRLMIQRMAYFRVKRRKLGAAYTAFLRERLAPGAPIIVLADESTWPATTIADRHVFQVGAQGGLRPEDYDRHGLTPDTTAAEAEWGFDHHLLDDLHRFAAEHGHPVRVLGYPEPHHLSATVANVYRTWLADAGTSTDRLLIESFLLIDPIRTLQAGLVPLWTLFAVESALDTASRYLAANAGEFSTVHIGLFPHGVRSAGLAEPSAWLGRLGAFAGSVELLGVDPDRYPADFAALVRYGNVLRRLPPAAGPRPRPGSLSPDRLLARFPT